MTEDVIYAVVAVVAAVFGTLAGRVFAVEAENRRMAVFAGTYVGAGMGAVTSLPIGSVLTVIMKLLNAERDLETLLDALDVTGTALRWGIASGAAGGLMISIIIVVGFNWWGRNYRAPQRP
jgi:hypothetical protein